MTLSLIQACVLLLTRAGLVAMTPTESISRKKSDKVPHRPTVEDCASYADRILSLNLPEEHYIFLLASKLQARAWNTHEMYFTSGKPLLNFAEPCVNDRRPMRPQGEPQNGAASTCAARRRPIGEPRWFIPKWCPFQEWTRTAGWKDITRWQIDIAGQTLIPYNAHT